MKMKMKRKLRKRKKKNFNVFMLSRVLLLRLPLVAGWMVSDAILPRKGLVTRAMSKRLQEDWARATKEGPSILMNLRVDF